MAVGKLIVPLLGFTRFLPFQGCVFKIIVESADFCPYGLMTAGLEGICMNGSITNPF